MARFDSITHPKIARRASPGKSFRFVDGHIAIGGFPSEAYYGGCALKRNRHD